MLLFLFDIDGTLLRGMPPSHRMALCEAAEKVYRLPFSVPDIGLAAGMTDSAIAWRMLTAAGLTAETISSGLADFFVESADAYERLVPADLRPFHTPYAQETLERLSVPAVSLGLVTGNIQRIAWTKLRAAGLADYFLAGGFGDEAAEREKLPPLAVARMQELSGQVFASEDVYVVGDTPADIACGAACNLRTIAVATGPVHSLAELAAAGADYAFADLGAMAPLLESLKAQYYPDIRLA